MNHQYIHLILIPNVCAAHCTLTRIINPSHPSIRNPPNRQLTCETYRYLTQTPKCIRELAIAIATVAISHRPHPIDPAATNQPSKPSSLLLAQRCSVVTVTIPSSLRTQAKELFRYRARIVGRSGRRMWLEARHLRDTSARGYSTATCQSDNGETPPVECVLESLCRRRTAATRGEWSTHSVHALQARLDSSSSDTRSTTLILVDFCIYIAPHTTTLPIGRRGFGPDKVTTYRRSDRSSSIHWNNSCVVRCTQSVRKSEAFRRAALHRLSALKSLIGKIRAFGCLPSSKGRKTKKIL
jgi:hypothetical protein